MRFTSLMFRPHGQETKGGIEGAFYHVMAGRGVASLTFDVCHAGLDASQNHVGAIIRVRVTCSCSPGFTPTFH
jgi:hypothetical protein